jgi:hypothetical protein
LFQRWMFSVILSRWFCWRDLRRWWKSCCIKMADNEWSVFQLNSVHCYSNSRMTYIILVHTDDLKAIERGVKNAFRWTWPVSIWRFITQKVSVNFVMRHFHLCCYNSHYSYQSNYCTMYVSWPPFKYC